MSRRRCALILGLSAMFALHGASGRAQQVYWTEYRGGTIRRLDASSGKINTVFSAPVASPRTIVIDSDEGIAYWTDVERGTIERAKLGQSSVETLVTGLRFPETIALDLIARKLYWGKSEDPYQSSNGAIQRSDLDGTNVENVITGMQYHYGLIVDPNHGKVYWSDGERTHRANLDGTQREMVIDQWASDLALDREHGKLYWLGYDPSTYQRLILRADLDGTNIDPLLTDELSFPTGLALDVPGGRLYWTSGDGQPSIRSANLDGSDVQVLFRLDASGIVIDTLSHRMYWTRGGISTANLDGSDPQDWFVAYQPMRLALNRRAARLYWSDLGSINSVNIRGQELAPVLARNVANPYPSPNPFGIALDLPSNDVYWTNRFDGASIHRVRLDGSDRETLLPERSFHLTVIALDLGARKMYWSETFQLLRANLDGSQVEVIAEGYGFSGLALDLAEDQVYWVGWSPSRILRSRLNGSDVETILNLTSERPNDIGLDLVHRKLYWSQGYYPSQSRGIWRANLDGSEIELFSSTSAFPVDGIFVDPCNTSTPLTVHDLGTFVGCLSGPAMFTSGQCYCSDWSGDAKVDLKDFTLLQRQERP